MINKNEIERVGEENHCPIIWGPRAALLWIHSLNQTRTWQPYDWSTWSAWYFILFALLLFAIHIIFAESGPTQYLIHPWPQSILAVHFFILSLPVLSLNISTHYPKHTSFNTHIIKLIIFSIILILGSKLVLFIIKNAIKTLLFYI